MRRKLDQQLVKYYSSKFDDEKYPYEPYKKLVWDKIEVNNKYSILGAWKSGCIKSEMAEGYRLFYFGSKQYYYTRRWREGTPAQKIGWETLNSAKYRKELVQISNEKSFNKPKVFNVLNAIEGIGFIYTLFVLHCENPIHYPLYDQPVWRAYLYFIGEDFKSAKVASQSWNSFISYAAWFKNKINSLERVHSTELDRALWTFGKELKKK